MFKTNRNPVMQMLQDRRQARRNKTEMDRALERIRIVERARVERAGVVSRLNYDDLEANAILLSRYKTTAIETIADLQRDLRDLSAKNKNLEIIATRLAAEKKYLQNQIAELLSQSDGKDIEGLATDPLIEDGSDDTIKETLETLQDVGHSLPLRMSDSNDTKLSTSEAVDDKTGDVEI